MYIFSADHLVFLCFSLGKTISLAPNFPKLPSVLCTGLILCGPFLSNLTTALILYSFSSCLTHHIAETVYHLIFFGNTFPQQTLWSCDTENPILSITQCSTSLKCRAFWRSVYWNSVPYLWILVALGFLWSLPLLKSNGYSMSLNFIHSTLQYTLLNNNWYISICHSIQVLWTCPCWNIN